MLDYRRQIRGVRGPCGFHVPTNLLVALSFPKLIVRGNIGRGRVASYNQLSVKMMHRCIKVDR